MYVRLEGGRRLYCDLLGPADAPVVNMAHSLSTDGNMWAEQVPALLAAGFRELRVDMRGHGGSDRVPGPCTMAMLAADNAVLLDELGIDKVHFVGLSMGGMLAQAFALANPNRLISLTLCDTQAQSPAGGKALLETRIASVRASGSMEPLADGLLQRWLTEDFKANHPARWRQIRETVIGGDPESYLSCLAAHADFDFTGLLGTLTVPTLVICGDDDPATTAAENQAIAKLIPGARYVGVPKARHLPNVEHPDLFNRVLLDWLAQNR